jgi:hypothetical protein
MKKIEEVPHTRGDTFSLGGFAKLDLSGTWTASSKVKHPVDGKLVDVETLSVVLTPLGAADEDGNTHAVLLTSSSEAQADWPVDKLLCDIRFADTSVSPNTVRHSPKFAIAVEESIT